MIHTKITNVLLFVLLLSLWLLAYSFITLEEIRAKHSKQEFKALHLELREFKSKIPEKLIPPELEPEPIKPIEFERKLWIPGIFQPVKRPAR